MFFMVLVSVLCNPTCTQVHTLAWTEQTADGGSGDNVWIHAEERPWGGWAVEVLKLSSCSECLWSQKLSFPSLLHKTLGVFCSLRKTSGAQSSENRVTLFIFFNCCIYWQEDIFMMKITLKKKASHIFKLCLDILASKKHWAPKHALPMTI